MGYGVICTSSHSAQHSRSVHEWRESTSLCGVIHMLGHMISCAQAADDLGTLKRRPLPTLSPMTPTVKIPCL